MALKLTLRVVPVAPVNKSGPFTAAAAVFPDTIVLAIVIVPVVVTVLAIPPPPWVDNEPFAVFPEMVVFWKATAPVLARETAPPDWVAVFPLNVLFWTVTVVVPVVVTPIPAP